MMSRIERFEDLVAWQKARELNREVYAASEAGLFGRDFALRVQIRKASVSVMANIAEGFERHGDREFKHFLSLARGSAGEVQSHLYAAVDAGFIAEPDFQRMYRRAEEVIRLINGLMKYLSSTELRGSKFRGVHDEAAEWNGAATLDSGLWTGDS
jgi:four helix bundle protein